MNDCTWKYLFIHFSFLFSSFTVQSKSSTLRFPAIDDSWSNYDGEEFAALAPRERGFPQLTGSHIILPKIFSRSFESTVNISGVNFTDTTRAKHAKLTDETQTESFSNTSNSLFTHSYNKTLHENNFDKRFNTAHKKQILHNIETIPENVSNVEPDEALVNSVHVTSSFIDSSLSTNDSIMADFISSEVFVDDPFATTPTTMKTNSISFNTPFLTTLRLPDFHETEAFEESDFFEDHDRWNVATLDYENIGDYSSTKSIFDVPTSDTRGDLQEINSSSFTLKENHHEEKVTTESELFSTQDENPFIVNKSIFNGNEDDQLPERSSGTVASNVEENLAATSPHHHTIQPNVNGLTISNLVEGNLMDMSVNGVPIETEKSREYEHATTNKYITKIREFSSSSTHSIPTNVSEVILTSLEIDKSGQQTGTIDATTVTEIALTSSVALEIDNASQMELENRTEFAHKSKFLPTTYVKSKTESTHRSQPMCSKDGCSKLPFSFRITSINYIADFAITTSGKFKKLRDQLQPDLAEIFSDVFGGVFYNATIERFLNGSVIVDGLVYTTSWYEVTENTIMEFEQCITSRGATVGGNDVELQSITLDGISLRKNVERIHEGYVSSGPSKYIIIVCIAIAVLTALIIVISIVAMNSRKSYGSMKLKEETTGMAEVGYSPWNRTGIGAANLISYGDGRLVLSNYGQPVMMVGLQRPSY